MALDLRSVAGRGLAIGVILSVTLVAFVYFAISIATRSHPVKRESATAEVSAITKIYRNAFGIPHIVGSTTSDVLFAQGYAHAQDRLWQMDVWRRVGNGTLAEVLGPTTGSVDAFMRAVGIENIAQQQWKNLPDETKAHLTAYSHGVTAYIRENLQLLSMEFDALQYVPADWKPTDCLIVGRVIAFELSIAFWNDLAYAEIAEQRGVKAMQEYIPRIQGPPFVLSEHATRTSGKWTSTPPTDSSKTDVSTAIDATRASLLSVRNALGIRGSAYGSNCWTVRTQKGDVLLANDPHLGVSLPSKWYQVHLTSDEMNVVGLSIPGIPFVLTGRNNDVVWGFTNAMVDDVDYIVERMDQTNNNYYLDATGKRQKIRFDLDTIRIKGDPDSLIYLRYTNNGCVISDFHLLREPKLAFDRKSTAAPDRLTKTALTFRWTATYPSNEIGALYRANTSKNVDELSTAFETWNAPALNIHAADKQGTLRSIGAGVIPNRQNVDPLLASGSWQQNSTWNGLIRLSTLGSKTKTSPGFLASANNAMVSSNTPFISTLYQPASRILRIEELIGVYTRMSVRDAQVMQQDAQSPYARSLVKRILPYLKKQKNRMTSNGKSAYSELVTWDASMNSKSTAAAVYTVFLNRLMYNTFEDELGTQLYLDWVLYSPNAFSLLDEIANQPEHELFNDYRTKGVETLELMVLRSFAETINILNKRLGTDTKQWTYGRLHTVTFPHLVGQDPLMESIMNAGPYEMVGDLTTLNNSEWSLQNPYASVVVSSARLISSLSDSVQYSVLPGGSSGQPLAAHYTDQMQLWLKGGYVRLPVSETPETEFTLFHVFTPSTPQQ